MAGTTLACDVAVSVKVEFRKLRVESEMIRIPFPLKSDDFKASYRQGFLVITVPKIKEPVSLNVEVKIQ